MDNPEEKGTLLIDIIEYFLREISEEERKKFQAAYEKCDRTAVPISPNVEEEMRTLIETVKRSEDRLRAILWDLLE